MLQATLCYPINASRILLGLKKKGFGSGKFNGFGGKVKPGESVEEAAIRELFEESSIRAEKHLLKKVAEITFYFENKPEWDQVVHAFLIEEWDGNPKESDEMKPEWFSTDKIPYDKMWGDDPYWLPFVLKGKKFKGSFTFSEDGKVLEHSLKEV